MNTDIIRIKCKHCARKTLSTKEAAWFLGWRFYTGPSITGKPLDDVLCPVHSGQEDAVEEIPTWHVRCRVCDWSTEDEWEPGDTPILTAYEASQVAVRHTCEPNFVYIDPGGKHLPSESAEFQTELNETSPIPSRKQRYTQPQVTDKI